MLIFIIVHCEQKIQVKFNEFRGKITSGISDGDKNWRGTVLGGKDMGVEGIFFSASQIGSANISNRSMGRKKRVPFLVLFPGHENGFLFPSTIVGYDLT